MDSSGGPFRFRVSGTRVDTVAAGIVLPDERKEIVNDNTRLHLYSVVSTRSKGPEAFEDARDGLDVVVLKVKDGPMLVLHPANARDLLVSNNPGAEKDGAVPVSTDLPCSETSGTVRGAEPATTLEWFGVIGAGQASAIGKHIALNIAKELDKRGDAGLFKLSRDVPPAQAASAAIKEASEAPEIAPRKITADFPPWHVGEHREELRQTMVASGDHRRAVQGVSRLPVRIRPPDIDDESGQERIGTGECLA